MDKSKIKQPNINQQQDKTLRHFGTNILVKKGEKKTSAFDNLPSDLPESDSKPTEAQQKSDIVENPEKPLKNDFTEVEATEIGDLPIIEKPVILEEIDLDIEPLGLIPKPKNNRYSIEHKIQALSFLFGSLKQVTDREGNPGFSPSYTSVSLLTGIPTPTLVNWWRQRAELEATASTVKESLSSFVSMKLLIAVNKAVDTLTDKMLDDDFKKTSIGDLMKIIKDGAFQSRVLGNLSTANVAHQHNHEIEDNFEHPDPLDN